jgi:quinol monooxygenase YgiN
MGTGVLACPAERRSAILFGFATCYIAVRDRRGESLMATQVYFLVEFTIQEGRLEAFQAIAQQMITRTRNESGALGYEWFLSPDRKRCRLLETYKDGDAVSAHISGSAVQLIPKLIEHAKIDRFEVYGDPGAKGAASLSNLRADIFALWQGLDR